MELSPVEMSRASPVESGTVIATHLNHALGANAADLLGAVEAIL